MIKSSYSEIDFDYFSKKVTEIVSSRVHMMWDISLPLIHRRIINNQFNYAKFSDKYPNCYCYLVESFHPIQELR